MADRSRDQLLTVQEVADDLRVDPETVRRMLRDGRMHGSIPVSTRSGWRIPTSEVTRLRHRGSQSKAGSAAAPQTSAPPSTAKHSSTAVRISATARGTTRATAQLAIDRKAEGGLTPRRPPYGLRVNEVGEWEQVPEEIAVIHEMARLRILNGASYPIIARHLNAAGLPGPKGGAKGWSPTAVWRILSYKPYWERPDPADAKNPQEAIRMAKIAEITGFLADAYPREAPTES